MALTLCRVGQTLDIRTNTQTMSVRIQSRSRTYDYALLECGAACHLEHLVVHRLDGNVHGAAAVSSASSTDSRFFLRGKALTLCAFQIGLREELPEFGEGADIDMGLVPAYGCKLSLHGRHLLYDVNSFPGNSGCAVLLHEGEVVAMHMASANVLMEQLDRDQEVDDQMKDVAESIAVAASSTAQLGVALLCHVFLQ